MSKSSSSSSSTSASLADANETCEFYACVHNESGEKLNIPKAALSHLPFLQRFFDPQSAFSKSHFIPSSEQYVLPVELHPELLKPILAFCKTEKFVTLLQELSTARSPFQLAQLFDFLGFDAFGLDADKLKQDMKNVNDDIGKHGMVFTKADRSEAREAAVKYCLLLVLRVSESQLRMDSKLRQTMYQQLLFIISHPNTFWRRIRYHAWIIASELPGLNLSAKQVASMQKWVPTKEEADEPFDYESRLKESDSEFSSGYWSD